MRIHLKCVEISLLADRAHVTLREVDSRTENPRIRRKEETRDSLVLRFDPSEEELDHFKAGETYIFDLVMVVKPSLEANKQ